MRVHRIVMPVIVIVLLLGGVQVANALGWWQTSGKSLVDMDNFQPEDIKGWMSLEQIAEGSGVPMETLYGVLGVPADVPPATTMKDLEEIVEVSEARVLLAEYLGVPVTSHEEEETVAEPTQAAPAEPTATVEPTPTLELAQETAVEPTATHVPVGDGTGDGVGDGTGTGPTPAPAGQLAPDDIKGRMTLREVSEGIGIDLAALLQAASLPADLSPDLALKDIVSQVEGFEVQTIRDAATELLSH